MDGTVDFTVDEYGRYRESPTISDLFNIWIFQSKIYPLLSSQLCLP